MKYLDEITTAIPNEETLDSGLSNKEDPKLDDLLAPVPFCPLVCVVVNCESLDCYGLSLASEDSRFDSISRARGFEYRRKWVHARCNWSLRCLEKCWSPFQCSLRPSSSSCRSSYEQMAGRRLLLGPSGLLRVITKHKIAKTMGLISNAEPYIPHVWVLGPHR